jgi:hypothetical protein
MGNVARRLSLQLGQIVQHVGPARTVGVIVGFLLRPFDRALVRWPSGGSTWERLDELEHSLESIGPPAVVVLPEQIQRLLDIGRLPVAAAGSRSVLCSDWTPCDACDELIAPGQTAFDVIVTGPSSRRLRLHPICHLLWKTERRRRSQSRAS